MQKERSYKADLEQVERVKKEALYLLAHYHERDGKQKLKDMAKKAAGRYVPPEDMLFWPAGLIVCTLQSSFLQGMEGVQDGIKLYFDRWIEKGMPVYYMDDALCGTALCNLYRQTKEEKYKLGADKLAEYLTGLIKKEADRAGSIPYRPAQKNGHIYVDGIGMICPFLVRYGGEVKDNRLVETALLQIKNMLQYGMDARTGLPYHGYEFEKREKYGIIGWGRAVGWLLMGMSGVLQEMWPDAGRCGWLVEAFTGLALTAVSYQKENGAFSWQLETLEGPSDSSATAMIASSMLTALQYDIIKEESHAYSVCIEAVRKAADYLSSCEEEGKIYECSGECLGFSQYPQIYGSYPWSVGPGLTVLTGALGLNASGYQDLPRSPEQSMKAAAEKFQ